MSSTVAELKKEGYKIQAIDVRYDSDMAKRYKVARTPAYVYLRGRDEIRRSYGRMGAMSLRSMYRDPLFD